MTNAKPTPGPYVVGPVDDTLVSRVNPDGSYTDVVRSLGDYGDPDQWPDMEARARLAADAFTVHHETGLTPRELAEQRAELLEIADAAVRALACDICNLVPDEDLQRWQAAIAKARGGAA